MGEYANWARACDFGESLGEFLGDSQGATKLNFTEHRRRHGDVWLCKDGRVLRIADMETTHISACINLLVKCEQVQTKAYRGLTAEFKRRTK